MDLDAFVRERRPRWDRFERLLDDTEAAGEQALDPGRCRSWCASIARPART